jgi:hypothetical protein
VLSVQTHIRDGHPDYIVTADSWPAFLYPKGKGDILDVEKGLFRSAILLKVCCIPSPQMRLRCSFIAAIQAFKFILTSPTSALDIDCDDDVDEHVPAARKRFRRNQKAPTRGHVANLLGMKTVTPRSLAYVAVQVCDLLDTLFGTTNKPSLVTLRVVKC